MGQFLQYLLVIKKKPRNSIRWASAEATNGCSFLLKINFVSAYEFVQLSAIFQEEEHWSCFDVPCCTQFLHHHSKETFSSCSYHKTLSFSISLFCLWSWMNVNLLPNRPHQLLETKQTYIYQKARWKLVLFVSRDRTKVH